ncbi:MAG: DUF1360 domain-containing protein [Solirubrobacterales bacterium]
MTEPDPAKITVEGYDPESQRPLGGYAVLIGVYHGLTALGIVGLRRAGRPFPPRLGWVDVALYGIATHKISRLLAKEKIAGVIRAPFTRYERPGSPGELEEAARGSGARYAIGELLTCPYCLAHWIGTALILGTSADRRLTRTVATLFTIEAISDTLQIAYKSAERHGLESPLDAPERPR